MTRVSLVLALLLPAFAWGHDFDMVDNLLGDSEILTLGGYTFAKPVVVNLAPTNSSGFAVAAHVEFQIVYRDRLVTRPDETTFPYVQATSSQLNAWLEDFVKAEYAGWPLARLVEMYSSRQLARDLQEGFPAYVAERLREIPAGERPDVDAVTVKVTARNSFRLLLHRHIVQSR